MTQQPDPTRPFAIPRNQVLLGALALLALIGLMARPGSTATRFLAMRVDTAALRASGDSTLVRLDIQIAPEDRRRVGRRAWVELRVIDNGDEIDSQARSVEVDGSGTATLELAWPPGSYELEVLIESAKGGASGLWKGRMKVPTLSSKARPTVVASQQERPSSARPPAAPSNEQPATTPSRKAQQSKQPQEAQEPEAQPSETRTPEPAAPAPTVSQDPEPRTPRLPVESAGGSRPTVESEPAAPEEAPGAADTAAAMNEETATADEAVTAPTEPDGPPRQPSASPTHRDDARGSSSQALQPDTWGRTGPGMAELTLVVTDRNRPISGLGRQDLRLELDGERAAIADVGDSTTAPLRIAIAVDLSASMQPHLADLGRQLSRLVLRLTSERDQACLLATASGSGTEGSEEPRIVLDWGAAPDQLVTALQSATESETDNLAGLITRAAAELGHGGRSFLVVVTDGGDSASRVAWDHAGASVRASGAQALLIGFRSKQLKSRTRKRLEQLVESSGGRSYLLRDTQTLTMVCDYFSELMDASYAVRMPLPRAADAGDSGLRVDLTLVSGADLELHHPRRAQGGGTAR